MGRDILVVQTGTGKTGSFIIPLIEILKLEHLNLECQDL